MRRSEDFRRTVRSGVRIGRPTLVLHAVYLARGTTPLDPRRAHKNTRARASATGPDEIRIGFVVGKAVGNAVTRNRVRRRLRSLAVAQLPGTPTAACVHVVVRALPRAATAPAELPTDLASAWSQAWERLGVRAPEPAGVE
jgi:ribonuclease P protein component